MVAAFEVLVGTSAARALIREGKTFQLSSIIQTGLRQGMMTLEQSLAQLVLQGLVTLDDAIAEANNPDYLQELVQAGKRGVASP
jgi:twitching motility protein PilT